VSKLTAIHEQKKFKCSTCHAEYDEMFPECPGCGDVYGLKFNTDAYVLKDECYRKSDELNEEIVRLIKERDHFKNAHSHVLGVALKLRAALRKAIDSEVISDVECGKAKTLEDIVNTALNEDLSR
jgi:hypothetical protein